MPLNAGDRLGPYEIVSPLGAGGMGEVYRARDARLGRDVAIKVVPPAVANNADALARFEREARAVAGLSHPHILTLHDFGKSDGITYAVMELLEGETLRARLAAGALPPRKAVEVASQVARGLAAAHDRHIAHRDLKPENIFITTDGSVKILDFGLARHTGQTTSTLTVSDSVTVAPATEPGVVLGTVGYMAPEQVRGETSDHRADIFALGCVLYEMLAGRRAYQRDTAAETMTAVLKEDPPDLAGSGLALAPALLRIVRRCLEKRPDERFQSARDLAFALESSLDNSSASATTAIAAAPSQRRLSRAPIFAIGLALGIALSAVAMGLWRPAQTAAAPPTFRQLTFERGTIRDARFTPDGQSVVYSAAWEGNPVRIFMTRTDAPESVRLSLPDARVLSIAPTGEMAVSLGHTFEGWMGMGTLARSSVLGSAPKILADKIREAAWTPDGKDLAVARRVGALEQLEFPVGQVLYKTSGYVSDLRFSPSGDRIAFADHPLFADDAGGVSIVDRSGQRTVLSDGWISVRGIAWSNDGKEVWFTATRGGAEAGDGLYAVTPEGKQRVVLSGPQRVTLFDIAPDGRVLVGSETADRRVEALLAGTNTQVDVSLRAASTGHWISRDGSLITIADQSTPTYTAYLLKAGGTAVQLGTGQPYGVSPDGRWAVALPVGGSPVFLHPTGAGQTRELPNPQNLVVDTVAWLPDSRHLVMFGQPPGQTSRGYVQDIDGGAPRPFTPEGVGMHAIQRWWDMPVSPDGKRVIAQNDEEKPASYDLSSGVSEALPGLQPNDVPMVWSNDGRELLVAHGNGLPWIVDRVDLATGRRTHALEIRAHDAAGLRLSTLAVSADGRHYVHSYSRLLTDLFIVEGLK